jgi:predicted peptidase
MNSILLWTAAGVVALTPIVGGRSRTEPTAQSLPPERPQDDVAGFSARVYTSAGGMMRYRLFVPDGLDPQKQYPIIVWLHGAGGMGVDNFRQLADDQVPGTQTWTEPANQTKHPAFVLAPQSSVGWLAQPQSRRPNTLGPPLRFVLAILDSLSRQYRIDQKRIYVAGQSDGGYGVWDLIANRPDRFAAAVILCGAGDPARAPRLVNLPLWVFHGSADPMVPVAEARRMVEAIRKAGGNPRYTEYKGVGHEIWSRVFAEPGLVEWLFAQHRS